VLLRCNVVNLRIRLQTAVGRLRTNPSERPFRFNSLFDHAKYTSNIAS